MKKFFTSISLQKTDLDVLHYYAVGNSKLQLEEDEKVSYPILTAVNGYVQPGEDFKLIAVMTDKEETRRNLEVLRGQLTELCSRKGFVCPKDVEVVLIEDDQNVSTHVGTFRKLLDYVDDGDELFSCMTFGTKPLAQAMMLAVQYAYRVKRNASISCIVYGEVDRFASPKAARVYDMTALIQMDEIVHMLAQRGISDPKAALDSLLAL